VRTVPITIAEANAYVQANHRHTGALPTARLAIAAINDQGTVFGVAIAGQPKARMAARPGVLEVSRVCTDGTYNGCSFLYGAITRAAKALGYWRLITYTLADEPGTSLKASGWKREADVAGLESRSDGGWAGHPGRGNHPGGSNNHDTGRKVRWAIALASEPPSLRWPEDTFIDPGQLRLAFDEAER
jgi:hypothetical protein